MKKIAKKLLLLALSTMLVGAGTTAVYNVYNEAPAITASAATEIVSDKLNRATTGATGTTYSSWSGKSVTSEAVYAGQSAGDKDSIQLRSKNNNSGVVTTVSGGKAVKVTVEWNSGTSSGRTLDVYGKNTAYTSPTELYDTAKAGTKIGSIVNGTSTVLEITGDYTYIGVRSNSGAMYLTSITFDWEVESSTPDVEEGATDAEKVQAELDALAVAIPSDVAISETVDLISEGVATPEVAIVWTLEENACASIETGDLVITNPVEDTLVKLTATASLNDVELSKTYEINVKSAASFLAEEVETLEVVASVEGGTTVQLPVKGTKHADTAIAWALAETEYASLDGNVLSTVAPEDDEEITLTATLSLAGVEVTQEYTVNVTWSAALARFEFGQDGGAAKENSTAKTTYTETDGDYTLSITGGSAMYPDSYDAKGNGILKLGKSGEVGSFSFTAPDDINRVVIKVAGRQGSTAKVEINGVTYNINTKSDDGVYTNVAIDTSVNKTVSFTTLESGADKRAYITEIVYEKTFALTTITGNQRLDPTCVTTVQYAYGATVVAVADPTAEGKTFAGWVDVNSNPVTLPETMPKEDVTVYASWDITPYTLTVVNGDDVEEYTFGVEAAGDI
ncbi:MAG: InlB B-repeat-containing protein, partial [Clostridia bacterium]|nr:InlB B-repeat-containing protein [Clostridia bacterium]